MKLVAYFENGMEGVALTPKQLELVRRGVACLYEDRKDGAVNLALNSESPDHEERVEAFAATLENDAEIVQIEQLCDILYRGETYERTHKEG